MNEASRSKRLDRGWWAGAVSNEAGCGAVSLSERPLAPRDVLSDAIHVMDRESDDYVLFARMAANGDRSTIEEYFKVIKTGCVYEARQLGDDESLCDALATFIPIACRALDLRSMARDEPK